MNPEVSVGLLLGGPFAGAVVLALPVAARAGVRSVVAITLVALGLTLVGLVGVLAGQPIVGSARSFPIGLGPLDPGQAIAGAAWSLAPVALSLVFVYVAVRARSRLLIGLALVQLTVAGMATVAELLEPIAGRSVPSAGALIVDPLAATLLIVSAAVGGLIVVYATGYEPARLVRRGLPVARTTTFLAWLLLFMSAMHLLVLADDLRLFAVGWEVTTLCSFALIGFDGDDVSRIAARRALAYNLLGGVALGVALLLAGPGARLSDLVSGTVAIGPGLPFILAGCVIAAATKSALVPFQPWLLGAMVAATPVSALLHASAMVKAGMYLLLRLAPPIAADGLLGPAVVLLGALSFATTALLALRERDLKRILALSTVSTLGLIAAAAGLGSGAALSAGLLLLAFHAVAKALAFLSVGAIEQTSRTRDLEALVGSLRSAPRLAGPLVIAGVALALPPFGLVVAKWAIIELGARNVLLVGLLALGGAAYLAMWTAVVARLIVRRADGTTVVSDEPLSLLERLPIAALSGGSVAGLVLAAPIARWLTDPAGTIAFGTDPSLAAGWSIGLTGGTFAIPAVAVLVLGAAAAATVVGRRTRREAPAPYLSGAGLSRGPSTAFHGGRGQPVIARSGGFYWGDGRDGGDVEEAASSGQRPSMNVASGDGPSRLAVVAGWLAIALVGLAATISSIGWGLGR